MNSFRARLERLEKEAADCKPVLLWIEPGECAEAAVKKHLVEHPKDAGREVLCLSWLSPGHSPAAHEAACAASHETNHLTRMEN